MGDWEEKLRDRSGLLCPAGDGHGIEYVSEDDAGRQFVDCSRKQLRFVRDDEQSPWQPFLPDPE